jgi:hypothetical protein
MVQTIIVSGPLSGGQITFWEETPRLIRSVIDGYQERINKQQKLAMSQAWHTAALPLTKKFPPLSDMLGEKKPSQCQTPDEMLSVMRAWQMATRH